MNYGKVPTGTIFFFEDNYEYPKKKSPHGHIDLRDGMTGYMPDNIPVITTGEIEKHSAIEAAARKLVTRWNKEYQTMTNSHDDRVVQQGIAVSDCADELAALLNEQELEQ